MSDDKEKHTPESLAVKVVKALLIVKPTAKSSRRKSKKAK